MRHLRVTILVAAALVAVSVIATNVLSEPVAGARPPCTPRHPRRCSTTTTTTIKPTTTTALATTTTAPRTTTTTAPPSGVQFSEDFSQAGSFLSRFDHNWGGEVQAGAAFNDAANDWQGDHNGMCGDPAATSRTIHVEAPDNEPFAAQNGLPKDVSQVFYQCAPGGDAAKAHLMTSVNTEGYATVWFSPRQVFTDVSKVCWDQNLTWQGGGKWTLVNFLTPAEYNGQADLGYTSPDFPSSGASSPQGPALNGVKYFSGGLNSYTNGAFHGGPDIGVGSQAHPITDKASRYKICVVDNNNGTLALSLGGPNGTVTSTVTGAIPNGSIRVEFADDSYNPDKHFFNPEQDVPRDSSGLYTWHWDNVLVS